LLQERLNSLQWLAVLLVLISVVLVSQRKRLWEPVVLVNEPQQNDLGA
jgi:drug/metabolite transporter (DMT)-like permease